MIKFRNKIRLVLFGMPIVKIYKVLASEKAFKEKVKSKMTLEKYLSPVSQNVPPFYGQFHGFYERELTLQMTTSAWRRGSLSDSISVHGEMNPSDENSLELKLTLHRSGRMRLSNIVLISFVIITLLIVWSNESLANSALVLPVTGFLLLFLASAFALSLSKIGMQFNVIENHLFGDFETIETTAL